ncbi:Protein NDUFAF4-like protein [Acromyrmex echinatior]|uniref:Protein NDUFAF4-like protein n=1 Tax=Acromyrmex echinatior TaxID=103372 RepID=F4WWN8_ACREC|nr:Protein NDUFAF4-like protein [Acromyrmex echinatior]
MGKIYSVLTRPIRTFNIENRAAKLISREKPVPAPQYASTEKQKKFSDQVNPYFLKDHYQKNMQLDQRLKDVFVTSTDSQVWVDYF